MSRARSTDNARDGEVSRRRLRVGASVRRALADIFTEGGFGAPAIDALHLGVSEVRMSPDLRVARVFVLPLGGGDMGDALGELARMAPPLRARVSRKLRLKFAPELRFEADDTLDRADRIAAAIAATRTSP